jgi:hypothetical protein
MTQGKCGPRHEFAADRNMTRRAKVARRKENSVGKDRTRDKVMLRTSKGTTGTTAMKQEEQGSSPTEK